MFDLLVLNLKKYYIDEVAAHISPDIDKAVDIPIRSKKDNGEWLLLLKRRDNDDSVDSNIGLLIIKYFLQNAAHEHFLPLLHVR